MENNHKDQNLDSNFSELDVVIKDLREIKHDFANHLAIFDGRIRKVEKELPELGKSEYFLKLKEMFPKFITIMERIQQARNRAEENKNKLQKQQESAS